MKCLKCDTCGKVDPYSPDAGIRYSVKLCLCGGIMRPHEITEGETVEIKYSPTLIFKGTGWSGKK
jgi:hypothetical protein